MSLVTCFNEMMDELEETEVDFRSVTGARPFSFARMLSWEFSRPSVIVVRRKSTRSLRKSDVECDVTGEENDTASLGSMSDDVVEGSDSSDYVTAEESQASEEEDLHQKDRKDENLKRNVVTSDELEMTVPPGERRRPGRSKKQKRKRNRVKRDARFEFFAPFIDGFDEDAVEEAAVAAAEHETPVRRLVPSLSEFCVQKLWGSLSLRKQPLQSESGR